MGRTRGQSRFTISVELSTNDRQAHIIDRRLVVVGKLYNAILGRLLGRVEHMRASPGYRAACKMEPDTPERTARFKELEFEYGLREYIGHQIWKESRWMGEVVPAQMAGAIEIEVRRSVKAWRYQGAGKPRYQASRNRSVAMGSSHQPIKYNPGEHRIDWGQNGRSKQILAEHLHLPIRGCTQAQLEKRINGGTVSAVGIQRYQINGVTRYRAMFSIVGTPYRPAAYLRATSNVREQIVGIDPGVSVLALAGEQGSRLVRLADQESLEQARKAGLHKRKLQRALDRSRRASNPECFDSRGRSIRGKRQSKKSRRARKLDAQIAEMSRVDNIHKRQRADSIAREVHLMGGQVAIEDNSYKTWQRSGYGARMLLTTPGMVKARIAWESKLLGGSFILLDQSEHCLSQYCLCGHRAKKPRGKEWHSCKDCGLGITGLPAGHVIHRDLYSAFLARLVQEHSVVSLHAGELNTGQYREQCLSLCVLPYAELRDKGHAHHQTILAPLALAGEQNRASRPTKRVPEAAPFVSKSSVREPPALVPHTGNTRPRRYSKVEPGTSVASLDSHGCRRNNPSTRSREF